MKSFVIENYRIISEDEDNWILQRKKQKASPALEKAQEALRAARSARKKASGTKVSLSSKKPKSSIKQRSEWIFWGYYPTLEAVRDDLAELAAKQSSSFKELNKWIKAIKSINQ